MQDEVQDHHNQGSNEEILHPAHVTYIHHFGLYVDSLNIGRSYQSSLDLSSVFLDLVALTAVYAHLIGCTGWEPEAMRYLSILSAGKMFRPEV